MRNRMKMAAVVSFLCVMAAFVLSGSIDGKLVTFDNVTLGIFVFFVAICLFFITYYFDRNYGEDGSPKRKDEEANP